MSTEKTTLSVQRNRLCNNIKLQLSFPKHKKTQDKKHVNKCNSAGSLKNTIFYIKEEYIFNLFLL